MSTTPFLPPSALVPPHSCSPWVEESPERAQEARMRVHAGRIFTCRFRCFWLLFVAGQGPIGLFGGQRGSRKGMRRRERRQL